MQELTEKRYKNYFRNTDTDISFLAKTEGEIWKTAQNSQGLCKITTEKEKIPENNKNIEQPKTIK